MKIFTNICIAILLVAFSMTSVVPTGAQGVLQKQQNKIDNRAQVKMMIRERMRAIFAKIKELPRQQQKKEYEKIIRSANVKIESGKLTQKEKLILKILKEVVREEGQKMQHK